MASVVALLVIATALVAAPVYGKDYVVGESQGWTSSVDYTTWAKDKTFVVGDTLTFQYGSFHSVDEVGESDYSSCSSSNLIQSYSDQNTKITLSKAGTRYFICGSTGHCSAGMKLAVPVSAASSATPTTPATTPATPSDNTPSTTPKTSTPSGSPATEAAPPKATTTSKSTTNTNGAMESGPIKGLLVGVLATLGLAFMG